MRLRDYLDESRILLDLSATEKDAAIEEVAARLRTDARVSDWERFLADVFERERLGTTALGRGVAVPHARTESVSGFVAAVGRSAAGVAFGAPDGEPVRLILVMGVPKAQVQAYLRLLAHLTLVLKRPGVVADLVAAPDAAGLLGLFERYEL